MLADPIARIRRFNRAVTAEVGALDDSFLGRGRPLGPARVLWSIRPEGTDVADIREALRLDSGLLSRILRGLEAEGLLTTEPSPTDRRRRIARLTATGEAEKAEYDRLNDDMAAGMLTRLSSDTEALLLAMDRIALALNRDRLSIGRVDPGEPQARACLSAYFTILTQRIAGFSATDIPDLDSEAAHYRVSNSAFLLARSDGIPVACVALKPVDATTGEVKRLWVAPEARGMGLARRMMTAIETEARSMGQPHLRLDTNEGLPEAIALYRKSGWAEVAPFTSWPATHWFAKAISPY